MPFLRKINLCDVINLSSNHLVIFELIYISNLTSMKMEFSWVVAMLEHFEYKFRLRDVFSKDEKNIFDREKIPAWIEQTKKNSAASATLWYLLNEIWNIQRHVYILIIYYLFMSKWECHLSYCMTMITKTEKKMYQKCL